MDNNRLEFSRSPPRTPRFHGMGRLAKRPHEFLHGLFEQYGDFVHLRGLLGVYLVNHPDFIRPVLSQCSGSFSKRNVGYRVLEQALGKGLLTNDGPDWVKQRRLMQPLFSSRTVNRFDATINTQVAPLMDEWETCIGQDTVWLDRDLSRLTLQIVGATLFGFDFQRHSHAVAKSIDVVNVGAHEFRALLVLWSWLPLPSNLRWRWAIKRLDLVVHELIETRRGAREGHADILERLLDARDEESGERLSERQLRDEIATLMLAGHETSANALVWTLYLLASHPDIDAQLAEELTQVLGGREATADDLPRLPYLKQVVQESMRIYPPAWGLSRQSEQDVQLGEFVLPAQSFVGIVPYALHRHREFWSDPERFDPDRFNPQRAKARHSYCYLPFGAGPRTCIGAGMAMLEIQLVLAQILQRFKVQLIPGHGVQATAKATLKPLGGLPVKLGRR